MDGKLVYTGAGTAGKAATSLTVPETVDYIVVRMVAPTAENEHEPGCRCCGVRQHPHCAGRHGGGHGGRCKL